MFSLVKATRRAAAAAATNSEQMIKLVPAFSSAHASFSSTSTVHNDKLRSPPLTYILGEEMTRYCMQLVLDKCISPHIDTSEWEFYDLEKDPSEMHSQYSNPEYAGMVTQLKKELANLREQYEVVDIPQTERKKKKPKKS